MKLLIVLLAVWAVAHCAKYDGYKIYKVHGAGKEARSLLNFPKKQDIEFLTEVNIVGRPISILVAPESQQLLSKYLEEHKLTFSVEVEDVDKILDESKQLLSTRQSVREGEVAFDRYLRYDEINSYLARLAADYPNLVTVQSIGQTYEGRETYSIHISSGNGDSKPTIFVDAGIHAREWISPALALYLINQLVENPDNQNLIEQVNWTILPTINPDGYEYSWDEERFWRKTRTPGVQCDGVDENRNFGYHWSNEDGADNECEEIYAGTGPFSTIEGQNVRDHVLSQINVPLYVTIHSCGQYILYPWGYAENELPDNWEELDALGHQVNDAIKAVNGTEYEVGTPPQVLYVATGITQDWAKGGANIPLSYTIELPCGGILGFDLPEDRIYGVVTETFEGIKVWHNYVVQNYVKN